MASFMILLTAADCTMDGKAVAVYLVTLVFCCAWQVNSQSVNCTAEGHFADTSDTTCQNYTLCIYNNSSGTYLSNNFRCPDTTVFNPKTGFCTASTNYVCNAITSNEVAVSLCTAEGLIPDPNSTNCARYIECVDDGDNYIDITYSCPEGTYFNPGTTNCEFDYDCPFSCTAAGRFADAVDCERYYFCVLTSNGSYIQQKYTCPPPSLFNPTTQICSSKYTCGK